MFTKFLGLRVFALAGRPSLKSTRRPLRFEALEDRRLLARGAAFDGHGTEQDGPRRAAHEAPQERVGALIAVDAPRGGGKHVAKDDRFAVSPIALADDLPAVGASHDGETGEGGPHRDRRAAFRHVLRDLAEQGAFTSEASLELALIRAADRFVREHLGQESQWPTRGEM